jgi:hypothetical protein
VILVLDDRAAAGSVALLSSGIRTSPPKRVRRSKFARVYATALPTEIDGECAAGCGWLGSRPTAVLHTLKLVEAGSDHGYHVTSLWFSRVSYTGISGSDLGGYLTSMPSE